MCITLIQIRESFGGEKQAFEYVSRGVSVGDSQGQSSITGLTGNKYFYTNPNNQSVFAGSR